MKDIFKQSSWLFFAQIITRVFGFFYTIFLAKTLGVLDFGLFSIGLAYFSIISSFSDFGFNRFLVREIAKETAKSWQLLWNILMLRLFLICVFFAAFSVVIYASDNDKLRVNIILLSSLAVLPQTIAITIDGVFVALRKLEFSSVALLVSSLATVIFGFVLITAGFGIYGAMSALIFGQLIYAGCLVLILYLSLGLRLPEITTALIKKALIGSLPYGFLGLLGLLYFRIDTIMLSYIKGSFETGIYSAAYRFLEALIFIPTSISLSLFPVFVKMHQGKKSEIKRMFKKIIASMGILGSMILLMYVLILPIVIKFFLPEFLLSVDVIGILALSIPLIFIYVPLSQIILSEEKYLRHLIIISSGTLLFNVVLNLALIPRFGFIGASVATVLSDAVSLLVIILFVQKFYLVQSKST